MSESKKPSQKNGLIWLVSGFILILASLVAFIYMYFKNSSSKDRQEKDRPWMSSSKVEKIKATTHVIEQARNEQTPINTTAGINHVHTQTEKGGKNSKMFEQAKSFGKRSGFLIIAPIIALVLAYFAQGVFDSTRGFGLMQNWDRLLFMTIPNRLWLGAGIYLVAMIAWMYSAPTVHAEKRAENNTTQLIQKISSLNTLHWVLLIIGFSLSIISMLIFFINGESGVVRGFWGSGLIIFILVQWLIWRNNSRAHSEAQESPSFERRHWIVLILILAAAFWLRFYQVATIPNDIHGDMASYGITARDLILGVEKNIFGYGFYGIPMMGFMPAAISMKIFGNNIFGLQMASVIEGLISLIGIYLITWRLFDNHRFSAFATILATISIPHIHFSRIAAYMDSWAFGCLALYFLIDGLKGRRIASFGIAGVLLGFTMQMYFSGRVLVFIIALFLLYALCFQRLWITQNIYGLIIMGIGALVAMGPGLVFHLMNWDSFMARSREVLIFTPATMAHLMNKYGTDSKLMVLLTQIKLSLLMFNQAGDTSTQFGYTRPMFNSLLSPLIVLGFSSVLHRWKESGIFLALSWLGLTATLGSILTHDAPFWPRIVGIILVAALLAALAIEQIIEYVKKTYSVPVMQFAIVMITATLAVSGYMNWDQYYKFAKNNGTAPAIIGRYINSLPEDITACSLLSGPPLAVRETSFFAWPRTLVDIPPDAPDSELEKCIGKSLVWVISPENIGRLDVIRTKWPDGIIQTYEFPYYEYPITFYLVGVSPPVQ